MKLIDALSNAYSDGLRDGAPKWIKTTDRLPEVCRHVLTYDGDDIREGYLTKQGRWMRRWNGASVAITHWMPLPPLPEPPGVEVEG